MKQNLPGTAAEVALLPKNTRRSLPMALLRAREVVMARFRPMLARHDITEQQWRVIRVLSEESPLDATEVAIRASILAPSLTRIIKALEARRLITRGKFADDGRRVQLAMFKAYSRRLRGVGKLTERAARWRLALRLSWIAGSLASAPRTRVLV